MTDYHPVALYIIENPETKTFYIKHVKLKYKREPDGKIIITSRTKLKKEYQGIFYRRNSICFGSDVLCRHIKKSMKKNKKLETLFLNCNSIITGFLFNAKTYPSLHMFDYGQKINDITMDEILIRIKEYRELYKFGYMNWEIIEYEYPKTLYGRTFMEKGTKQDWIYVKRDEPYECINIRNTGLTQNEKNKNKYEKKKQNISFKFKVNRKQVLINIKKRGKQPKNSTIDKYGITEDEIKNIV
tara:strand:- start:249 stop:974 length:726 start_codon:yes stop_codon:yes gene_type:complete